MFDNPIFRIQLRNSYSELVHKPRINGVELNGDLPSTAFGLPSEATNYAEVTHAQIKQLRDAGSLKPGVLYRITDYVATTNGFSDTQSANHPFDIVVFASNANELSERCFAARREGDEYFANSNLGAWDVRYSIDNDTERFPWADVENGKGVIYRLVDEANNDAPFDFKGLTFKNLDEQVYMFGLTEDRSLTPYANGVHSNLIVGYDDIEYRHRIPTIAFACPRSVGSETCGNKILDGYSRDSRFKMAVKNCTFRGRVADVVANGVILNSQFHGDFTASTAYAIRSTIFMRNVSGITMSSGVQMWGCIIMKQLTGTISESITNQIVY